MKSRNCNSHRKLLEYSFSITESQTVLLFTIEEVYYGKQQMQIADHIVLKCRDRNELQSHICVTAKLKKYDEAHGILNGMLTLDIKNTETKCCAVLCNTAVADCVLSRKTTTRELFFSLNNIFSFSYFYKNLFTFSLNRPSFCLLLLHCHLHVITKTV